MKTLQDLVLNVQSTSSLSSYKYSIYRLFSFDKVLLYDSDVFVKWIVGAQLYRDAKPLFAITLEKPLWDENGNPNQEPLRPFFYESKKIPLHIRSNIISPLQLVKVAEQSLKSNSF